MEHIVYFSGKIKELHKFLKLLQKIDGKIIAVDIDNTLVNVNENLEKWGYDITVYPNPQLSENFWISVKGFEILFSSRFIPITISFIKSFTELGAEVVFVTSRSRELEKYTKDWAEKHLPGFEVYFTKEKHLIDADIYVEDDPYQIQKLISLNKTVLVPEWPYNQLFKTSENVIYYKI